MAWKLNAQSTPQTVVAVRGRNNSLAAVTTMPVPSVEERQWWQGTLTGSLAAWPTLLKNVRALPEFSSVEVQVVTVLTLCA